MKWPWVRRPECKRHGYGELSCYRCAEDTIRGLKAQRDESYAALQEIREGARGFRAVPGSRASNMLVFIFMKARGIVGEK